MIFLVYVFGPIKIGGGGVPEPSLGGEDPDGQMSSDVGAVSVYPRKPVERGVQFVGWVCAVGHTGPRPVMCCNTV